MDGQAGEPIRRFGGFDVLRIVAALAVILSHSFALTGNADDRLQFSVGHYRVPLGTLGVSIFFVVSGFLVAKSWDRTEQARVFVRHRFARIWPALTLVVVLTVAVLGPLVTTASLGSYVGSSRTILYLGRNVVLFAGTINQLPGVFLDNPVKSVNGSIWTLTYEVWAYVGVLALGVWGGLRRWWTPVVVLGLLLVFFRVAVYGGTGGLPITRSVLGLTLADGSELWSYFFAGVVLSRVARHGDVRRLALPGALLVGAAFVVGEPVLYILGIAALVIGIGAFGGRFTDGVHRLGDPSYGIYIFAWPVQQLVYAGDIARTPWAMFVTVGLISTVLGYVSWHFLERPITQWAKRRPSGTLAV